MTTPINLTELREEVQDAEHQGIYHMSIRTAEAVLALIDTAEAAFRVQDDLLDHLEQPHWPAMRRLRETLTRYTTTNPTERDTRGDMSDPGFH